MAKKKFDPEYIAYAKKELRDVMYKEPAPKDWIQMCLNVRQVMLAAATVYGNRCDEDTDRLLRLLQELIVDCVIPNLLEYDITVIPKE